MGFGKRQREQDSNTHNKKIKDKMVLGESDGLGRTRPDQAAPVDKENPFVTKNVEEELDYAAQGMKYMYENGGKQFHLSLCLIG